MRTKPLVFAAALSLASVLPASAQVTVNGVPATISGVFKFTWNNADISASNPVPVTIVSGGGGGGGGDASAANQQTQIARMPTLGQKTAAGSTPVVLATDQSAIPVTGTFWQATQPVSAASWPLPTGAAQDSTLTARLGTLGQKTMAASTPVALASDQSTLPVSLASVPSHAVTNAGTFAVQNTAATPAGANSIGTVGLNAGTNLVGKFGIDQTTPGTTNGVVVNSSVLPTGSPTLTNQNTELASLATIAQRATFFTDATGTATTSNGTFTGTTRDLGAASPYTRFNVAIFASQGGNVKIVGCQDSGCTTTFDLITAAVTTSSYQTTGAVVPTRYVRVLYINNNSTAGAINMSSSLTAN